MSSKTENRTTGVLTGQATASPWDMVTPGAPICVAATATALPEHIITIEDVRRYCYTVFPLSDARIAMMLEVVQNAKVDKRYFIFPGEYTIVPRSLEQTTKEYQEHSVRLGREVAEKCLKNAGLAPTDIDAIITTSCTGVIIPSLDAFLINDMGFRSDVRRIPITELGCAAGSAALGRAWDFLKGVPDGNVLIVSVELPSLTFQRRDISPANLISAALFGDGAAAAVISRGNSPGRRVSANGNGGNGAHSNAHKPLPRILGARSHLFPQTIDAMGFDLKDGGLHIVLSKDVPQLIRDKIRGLVDSFLGNYGMRQEDITAFVLHPGGQKLLRFIEEELGLTAESTRYSWETLRDYGNLSSASVLFVLQEWMEKGDLRAGDYGLLVAFGPGFSAEMMLLQWS